MAVSIPDEELRLGVTEGGSVTAAQLQETASEDFRKLRTQVAALLKLQEPDKSDEQFRSATPCACA